MRRRGDFYCFESKKGENPRGHTKEKKPTLPRFPYNQPSPSWFQPLPFCFSTLPIASTTIPLLFLFLCMPLTSFHSVAFDSQGGRFFTFRGGLFSITGARHLSTATQSAHLFIPSPSRSSLVPSSEYIERPTDSLTTSSLLPFLHDCAYLSRLGITIRPIFPPTRFRRSFFDSHIRPTFGTWYPLSTSHAIRQTLSAFSNIFSITTAPAATRFDLSIICATPSVHICWWDILEIPGFI